MQNRFDNAGIVWVTLIFSYAYIVRLLIIYFAPELVYWTVPEVAWPAFNEFDVVFDTVGILLAVIMGFTMSLILSRPFALSASVKSGRPSVPFVDAGRSSIVTLLLASVLLASLLNSLAYTYGIGRQGQFNEESLPFKLAGVVVYAKTAVIPALLLVQIYWAEASGMRWLARAGVLVLIALGFMDMFMLDSRGAGMKPVLLLALVWWSAGFRLQSADRLTLLFLGFLLLATIQMVTSVRLYGEQSEESLMHQIFQGIYFVLFRITGVEQFMVIKYLGSPIPFWEVWDVLTSPRGIPGYYTTNILGVDENLPQTFAPSGLGWLYLVGGLPGVIAGAAVIGIAAKSLWRALDSQFTCCAPVIKSFYLLTLFMLVAEGSMEPALISLLISAVTLKSIGFARRVFFVKHGNTKYMQKSRI